MNEVTNSSVYFEILLVSTSNEDNLLEEAGPDLPQWVLNFDIFWLSTYMVEKVVGLSANLLTILAIIKYEKLSQQPSNVLIGSLALADCMNFLAAPFECIAFSNTLDMSIPPDKEPMNIACYLFVHFWHTFLLWQCMSHLRNCSGKIFVCKFSVVYERKSHRSFC